MSRWRRAFRDLSPLALTAGLLAAVYLLPPDTSLAEVRRLGALDVCVPLSYPPLVTGDAGRPGFEVELLQQAAQRMGLRLTLNTVPAMGESFNPRSWRITRARCHVVAGGVTDTPATRSFLDLTLPHAQTGWGMMSPREDVGLEGRSVGVLIDSSGADRLAVSSVLRNAKARPQLFRSPDALVKALSAGSIDVAIGDRLLLDQIASGHGWSLRPVPGLPAQQGLAFGLWKGDLTLKRALNAALADLDRDGTTDMLRQKYLGAFTGA
ncbi:ABC transporter substrate-binding protein [Paracoccus suum]|uniref:ABC transporter substrate-binding protein n=1 Tax=Paracoccus suum TaxID=2259340 RepID=A0A344PMF3_9RHOB|nr:transporter substrate-binding domain-containing protein [Paracoccus suum]AXC50558.1 ABC transporter substrate-binding protein [Paracoccus suum]